MVISSKRKRDETTEVSSSAPAPKSVISSSEIAFPRGGATALTPLEVKEIANEAAKDVLFESEASKKSQGKTSDGPAKKLKKVSKSKKQAVKTDQDEEEQVQIENFSFKNLIPGSAILGQVSDINKLDIAISMGDNLVGYVPITSISEEITQQIQDFENQDESDSEEDIEYNEQSDNEDETTETKTATLPLKESKEFPKLQDFLKIGQWVRAQVVEPSNSSSKSKKRIQLTIEPKIVNEGLELDDLLPGSLLQCSIKSIEDHGIILNTGRDLGGFISNKELKDLNPESLKVGSIVLASLVTKPTSRTITLKPVDSVIKTKKNSIQSISTIDAVLPGILVDALVTTVSKNGVIAKVFGLLDATFNLSQLNTFDLTAIKHKFAIGSVMKARVLGVLLKNGTKKLILSALPHIINFSTQVSKDIIPLEAFPIGHIFDEVEIKGIDPNYLYAFVGSAEFMGQVHNSKIDVSKDLAIDYSVGSKHKARVIGYNFMDNVLLLSMEPKLLETKYVRPQDVQIGELVTAEIKKILPDSKGIELSIFNDFNAFVPGSHMSDIKLIYPERKFKVGSKCKARVLNFKNNKIIMTMKKSLVNVEDEQVLTDFEKATIGFKTPVTVEKFVHNGAIVSFFGNLRAFLPKAEISETFVAKADDHLRLGQTVNVRILTINNDDKKLTVTLRQSTKLSEGQKAAIDELQPGKSIITVSIIEKTKDSVIVEVPENNLRGVIAAGQLSDGNFEQNRSLLKKLTAGSELRVLVLEKDLKARVVSLTAKQSLIEAAEKDRLPIYFKDIKVGPQMLQGYIKSVTNLGLFINFAGKLTGLVLSKYATDKKVDDLSSLFYKYQSVSCRVIRVDEENKRFLLSLKESVNDSKSEEAINPVDSGIKYLSEYVPGKVTKAIVKSAKGTQLNVQLADNLQGRVDITQVFNKLDEIKDKKQPLSQFHKNDEISVKIVGYHDAKTHRFLPITHKKSNKNIILELSMLDKHLKSEDDYQQLTLADTTKGSKWLGFVNNIAQGFAWVSISPSVKGRVSFMELTNDISILEDLDSKLPIGSAIEVTVKEVDTEHNSVSLTAVANSINSIDDVKIGSKYPARVLKVKEIYVLVDLNSNVTASSFITDALNDYSEKLENVFHPNDFVTATVLSVDKDAKKVTVSLRTGNSKDKMVNSHEDLKRGDVVRGFVKNVGNNGVYVSLGRNVHGLVRITDLSDSYLKDWKKYYKPHQPVIGKVSSCKEEGRILITLKESEINGELNVLKKFDDLEVGEIYEGSVRKATDFGVFVKLDGTLSISGLSHRSEISDNKVENVSSLFGEGDRVKVKILSIDKEKKQLSLGMKASYFTSESANDEDVEMEGQNDAESDEENASESESHSEEDENDESDDEVMQDAFANAESDAEDSQDEDDEDDVSNTHKGLSTNGFDWTASILDQAEEDISSDEDEDFTNEKKKKKKKNSQRAEDKTADINTRAPQSVSDFERLLVGNPDSSILWINFMVFQFQLGEIEKAREVANRALKTINFRKEQERLNVWIALINFENEFGSDENVQEVFKRSCEYMDSLVMHQKLATTYIGSKKYDKADDLFKTIHKKFGQDVASWVNHGSYLLDLKRNEEARAVLAKALQVVSKKEHIQLVRKFAQLEFLKGDPEQGRSLFEGLIADAPKRIDLWNVYIDQEIKKGAKTKAEDLFERVITKKLSRKQAKFFFSKWLVFETEQDDQNAIARVKAKAVEYAKATGKD